jgi:hypothetical protein
MNCIIVPIYKDFQFLTKNELLSLHQLLHVLGRHDLFLVTSKNINTSIYLDLAKKHNVSANVEIFRRNSFSNIDGYNKLMTSFNFYKSFEKYSFMLIYQLDAYVFKDELDYWCKQGYDYIGAPWTGFKNYKNKPLLGVGNGGFSLRNVRKSLQLLRTLRWFEVLYSYRLLGNKSIISRLPIILKKLMKAHKFESKFEKDYRYFEDIFWCKGVEERLNSNDFNSYILKLIVRLLVRYDFKIAPVEIASRFSIEADPKKYYELNNRELPFGCHAWEKYESEFWKEFIPAKPIDISH